MGKPHYCKAVAQNYSYYCKIKAESKTLISNMICLSDRKNHKGHEECETLLRSKSITDELLLCVEGSKSCKNDFKFKIFNRSFMPQPCFRFDSDGDVHTNLGDIPLSERQIRPPHFHEFNESGIEFAYKTDVLNEQERFLVDDRLFALAHFSKEENIIYSEPLAFERDDLFDCMETVYDPLSKEAFYEQ